jgi:hypothetical protein
VWALTVRLPTATDCKGAEHMLHMLLPDSCHGMLLQQQQQQQQHLL